MTGVQTCALPIYEIVNHFDHALTVSKNYGKSQLELFSNMFGNVIIVDYQPTCENLVADFARRIKKQLPGSVILHSLKLYETATSYAEWFTCDNE